MPNLSRISVINTNEKKSKILDYIPARISPGMREGTLLDLASNNFVLVINAGTAYNLTPNVTFTANVMVWGAGGGAFSPNFGGGGGFSTGTIIFEANVSYNIVAGIAGSTAAGGGGSGIEYLVNANPIIIAGGGGAAASATPGLNGGAGGGLFAANATSGGVGATAYGKGGDGIYRVGGPGSASGAFGMGSGGIAAGGGGGGMYGGGFSGSGGGGGSGYINYSAVADFGNTLTGSGTSAANPSHPFRGNYGDASNNGIIIITVINT